MVDQGSLAVGWMECFLVLAGRYPLVVLGMASHLVVGTLLVEGDQRAQVVAAWHLAVGMATLVVVVEDKYGSLHTVGRCMRARSLGCLDQVSACFDCLQGRAVTS